ncbi:MAG TPA: hypothetical protein PKD37_06185 [Oligoflexia bacterium]|nr:hypothetical protein [Oligoflexia bacterium]HMP27550.1 hypothetical protein [Oligoflexia bacterium]
MVLGGSMGRMPPRRPYGHRNEEQRKRDGQAATGQQPALQLPRKEVAQAVTSQKTTAFPKVSEQARAESIQQTMGNHYIGLSELNKIFGTQAVISEKPMPPSIMVDMLSSNFPLAGDGQRKIRDTHFLIYLPDKINGENVTLLSFSELVIKVGQKFGRSPMFHSWKSYYQYELGKWDFANVPFLSKWLLLPVLLPKETLNRSYSEQKKVLNKSFRDYSIANAADHIAGLFLIDLHLKGNRAVVFGDYYDKLGRYCEHDKRYSERESEKLIFHGGMLDGFGLHLCASPNSEQDQDLGLAIKKLL